MKLELPAIRYQKASQIFSTDEYNTTNVDRSSMSLFSCPSSTERLGIGKKALFRINDFKIDFEKIEDKEQSSELKRRVFGIRGKYKIHD